MDTILKDIHVQQSKGLRSILFARKALSDKDPKLPIDELAIDLEFLGSICL